MAKRLLTLSFHLPEKFDPKKSNLREDALFKKHGLASGLLDQEAFGDVIPPRLKEVNPKKTPASGLESGEYKEAGDTEATTQITLLRVGANAWWRKEEFAGTKDQASLFSQWLTPHLTSACQCLFLAGHHSTLGTKWPVLWGAEDRREKHRYFTAFVPTVADEKPYLTVKGHPYQAGKKAIVRVGPVECSALVKDCRMIVIVGCSGTSRAGKKWQQWVETSAGVKPIILGWHGIHGMPKDRFAENFSQKFWERLKQLSAQHQLSFQQLCEDKASDVIGAWGTAVKGAFATGTKSQRHLWFASKTKGAGAIDPDGKVWRVLSADGELEREP